MPEEDDRRRTLRDTAHDSEDADAYADDQAHRAFGQRNAEDSDESGQRFRDAHPEDTFSGASGVLFEQAMAQTRMAICLSDPHQDDAPIVFANRAFRELTGYADEEVVGRNCRFLQGEDTSPIAVSRIRTALEKEDVVVTEILNYRKDGTPFWNALHIGPIYDAEGKLIYFFGSQWDVTNVNSARADERHAKLMSRELSHRVKNMFAVMGGIVTATGRAMGAQDVAHEINSRIQALGRAYETTLDDAQSGAIDVGEAIGAVLRPYGADDRIRVSGGGVLAPPSAVASLGLTLHELAINAIKHGALSAEGGSVEVTAQAVASEVEGGDDPGARLVVHWQERGGPRVEPPDGTRGMGTGITDALLRSAGGELERDWQPGGLVATVRLEIDGPLGTRLQAGR